ncbi:MAG: hypothetical protein K2W96_22695 [Gemmataceae bacterium]|nr:hypothetical protein [Gemmataceae bacterium]
MDDSDPHDLGSPEEEYKPLLTPLVVGRFVVALLAAFGVACLFFVGRADAAGSTMPTPLLVSLAVAFWLIAALVGAVFYRAGRAFWQVYPDALVRLRAGKRDLVVPWDRVVEIRANRNSGSNMVGLANGSGGWLWLGGFWNPYFDPAIQYHQLSRTVARKVAARMVPRALEAFGRGETVWCGPLGINRTRLCHAGRELPLDRVGVIVCAYNPDPMVSRTQLRIVEGDSSAPWLKLNAIDVPNLSVFLEPASRACPGKVDAK